MTFGHKYIEFCTGVCTIDGHPVYVEVAGDQEVGRSSGGKGQGNEVTSREEEVVDKKIVQKH